MYLFRFLELRLFLKIYETNQLCKKVRNAISWKGTQFLFII